MPCVMVLLFFFALTALYIPVENTLLKNHTIHEKVIKMNSKSEEFPDTLEGFGYTFHDGKLINKETGAPFEFHVSENEEYNQKRYEALGDVITNYIYQLLEEETGLKKLSVPVERKNDEPQTFIFVSDDVFSNPDKLILFIHGSGVVRAGQWARRLIINDCIDSGSQIPFIKLAQQQGYAIMVLNSNDNVALKCHNKPEKIRGSETPESHVNYVWEHLVSKAAARHIAIVAHSYGGFCTIELANHFTDTVMNRVFAIALTDSVHSLNYQRPSETVFKWLQKVARNWVSCREPLDTPVTTVRQPALPSFSAGDKRHEMASWASINSIFSFLSERYQEVQEQEVQKSEL